MTEEAVQYTLDGNVGVLCLNRPDKLNSMNGAMRVELRAKFFRASQEARAILITGAGRAFCAGQDLGDIDQEQGVDLERILREEYAPIAQAINDAPVPVICAVNGPAAGAGANLALCADLVIAARSAAFLQAFARIGLMPDAGGTYWLPRLIGLQRAMGMCLLAEPIDAETAERWGLVWKIVEDERLREEAMEIAHRLARGPTVALRLTRRALRTSVSNDFARQLELEAISQREAGGTEDFLEGVAAFLEKRPASFKGT